MPSMQGSVLQRSGTGELMIVGRKTESIVISPGRMVQV